MYAKPVQQIDHMRGKSHAHGHVGDGILQDQVPADNPRNQLAHGGVGIGVGAARNGNHRRHLGVAETRKAAHHRHQQHGNRKRGSSARPANQSMVMDQVVEQRRINNRRRVELLPGDSGPNDREDARTDNRPNAQRCQRPWPKRLLQPLFRQFGIADELVDRLAGKKLTRQIQAPSLIDAPAAAT